MGRRRRLSVEPTKRFVFLCLLSSLCERCGSPASPAAVDSRDDKQPFTDSWSFTVSQRTPWQSRLEVAYVGNRSRDLANAGGYGSNLNLVPLGAITAAFNAGNPHATNPALADPKYFRPLNRSTTGNGYGDVNQNTNNAYANYNALQVTWGRHAGRYTMQANYTWQKALGIVLKNANGQSNGSISLNPFDLRANYGSTANRPPESVQLRLFN